MLPVAVAALFTRAAPRPGLWIAIFLLTAGPVWIWLAVWKLATVTLQIDPSGVHVVRHWLVRPCEEHTFALAEVRGPVTVNGKAHRFERPVEVAALLSTLNLVGKKVAVERNGEIVPRSAHASTVLADGDQLEIVVAVGGG